MSERVSDIIIELDGDSGFSITDERSHAAVYELLPKLLSSKGIEPNAIAGLATESQLLGRTIDSFLLGNNFQGKSRKVDTWRQEYLNMVVAAGYAKLDGAGQRSSGKPDRQVYQGSAKDNATIIKNSTQVRHSHLFGSPDRQRDFRRNGASRKLLRSDVRLDEAHKAETIQNVPIAIVGAGASGILTAGYLQDQGFSNITVFDKRGRTNGIWAQDNVRGGSKNNPFDISFLGTRNLTQASSDRVKGSGRSIDTFLTGIFTDSGLTVRKASVKSIMPGDLRHEITFQEDGVTKTEVYPIVVYAPGIGEPLHSNDPKRMSTPMERNEVGIRWQQQLDKASLRRMGNMVVFIGLGNSTAEMVHQLQTSRYKTPDYRVLTHLPSNLLNRYRSYDDFDYRYRYGYDHSPRNRPKDTRGQLYRDTTLPELSRLAGDLPHIDRLVRDAWFAGKIICGVRNWHHEGGILSASTKSSYDDQATKIDIPFDKLYTLIGYGQNLATNDAMGLQTRDTRTGSVFHDFDAEVQCPIDDQVEDIPRSRVFPGYFALGPILTSPYNPNALVIPGIQYQLQFLTGTLVMRAAEVAYSHRYEELRKAQIAKVAKSALSSGSIWQKFHAYNDELV